METLLLSSSSSSSSSSTSLLMLMLLMTMMTMMSNFINLDFIQVSQGSTTQLSVTTWRDITNKAPQTSRPGAPSNTIAVRLVPQLPCARKLISNGALSLNEAVMKPYQTQLFLREVSFGDTEHLRSNILPTSKVDNLPYHSAPNPPAVPKGRNTGA